MISSITNPELFTTAGADGTRTPKKVLDKDAFLQLLVTQLKNQDPSNTMDVFQMSSQLAQFAGVEQLTQLNDAMAAQAQATQLAMLVSQTSFSSSLLGKEILAYGDQVHVPESGQASVHIEVGGSGGQARLRLLDDSGQVVATKELGRLGPGAQDVTLPRGLPAGNWHYAIDVTDADGEAVTVGTTTSGTVTGVQFENGRILLRIGGITVTLDDLLAIGRASTTSTPPIVPPSTPPANDPPMPDPGTPDDRIR